MKVNEVMTRQVECIAPDTTIKEAAERMKRLDVGFLPICEKDQLIGAITDRDITIRAVAAGLDLRKSKALDIMSPQVFYCFDDQNINDVGRSMQDKEVKRMVILDRDKKLVGIVSLGDISKANGEQQLAGETLKEISEAA